MVLRRVIEGRSRAVIGEKQRSFQLVRRGRVFVFVVAERLSGLVQTWSQIGLV